MFFPVDDSSLESVRSACKFSRFIEIEDCQAFHCTNATQKRDLKYYFVIEQNPGVNFTNILSFVICNCKILCNKCSRKILMKLMAGLYMQHLTICFFRMKEFCAAFLNFWLHNFFGKRLLRQNLLVKWSCN
jgi:hypothetical protein